MNLNPKGCTGIGDELASGMEYCRNRALNLFTSYGYRIFSPAEFQLIESTWKHLSKQRKGKLITLNSPFGEACCLRADLTLSAVAYSSKHFAPHELPLRLCYADRTFSAPTPPHENLETNQIGLELLGWETQAADLEVLTLAMRLLDNLGLNQSVLVLGDVSITSHLFSELPSLLAEDLLDALLEGQYVKYHLLLSQWNGDLDKKRLLDELPYLKGTPAILEKATDVLGYKCLSSLQELVLMLSQMGYRNRLRIDLGFVRDLGYYSGPIFNIYASPSGPLLGGGGRYDRLLSDLNLPGQAIGFGLNLRELSLHCQVKKPEVDTLLWGGSSAPEEALLYASKLNNLGIPFELSWHSDQHTSQELSKTRGYSWWINKHKNSALLVKTGETLNLEDFEKRVSTC